MHTDAETFELEEHHTSGYTSVKIDLSERSCAATAVQDPFSAPCCSTHETTSSSQAYLQTICDDTLELIINSSELQIQHHSILSQASTTLFHAITNFLFSSILNEQQLSASGALRLFTKLRGLHVNTSLPTTFLCQLSSFFYTPRTVPTLSPESIALNLGCLKHLTRLSFLSCTTLTDSVFVSIPESLIQQLTHLEISGCRSLSFKTTRALAQKNPQRLKYLNIDGCDGLNEMAFAYLALIAKNCRSMRVVSAVTCAGVTDAAILTFAEEAPMLDTVLISHATSHITHRGLVEANRVAREKAKEAGRNRETLIRVEILRGFAKELLNLPGNMLTSMTRLYARHVFGELADLQGPVLQGPQPVNEGNIDAGS